MKKLWIIPILGVTLYANSENRSESLIAEYKNMFNKIGEKRIGVEDREIDALKAPFVQVEKKKTASKGAVEQKSEPPFVLQAILNNSAKISGKWYPLHGEVNGMKIVSVRNNYVWLKNDEYRKKLTLGIKNEKISIK